MPLFEKNISARKAWLNDKVVGCTELDIAKRITDLVCATLKVMCYPVSKHFLC
jgi:hypothetical protein